MPVTLATGSDSYAVDMTPARVTIRRWCEPEKKVAVAVLLADGNKNSDTVVSELLAAIQPLLGG
ncbi:hypothetical protein [Kribbella sp. VKM Ac-2568]|uniref:hypothetical protein n=1 Tax=Kribbella sp. VKM Ac-2568 TaxID=2512219 RepID=UPI0010EF25E3|nr:hypothetical protein [Kribbella sp. VKM Ac-2568]TCM50349.1 hypothetical protein EV648_102393 [Kribbella sp. VKM Ac-2568]